MDLFLYHVFLICFCWLPGTEFFGFFHVRPVPSVTAELSCELKEFIFPLANLIFDSPHGFASTLLT